MAAAGRQTRGQIPAAGTGGGIDMTSFVEFAATREDLDNIRLIADRVQAMGLGCNRVTLIMDLEAVHCNGCPLDFVKLLGFPELDFVHDIAGITSHIDRNTGKLQDCFVPRCMETP